MTKWSLGYEILRAYLKPILYLFYKKVETNGVKNIPKKKPVIFAPNHQNALMDPLAIIFTNPKQTVFLTRADIFQKPLLLKIFTSFKMLPVYRIRDGAESLKNNERIFNKSVEILEANASLALFPEATHSDKRSLRLLKKAVPRIAFQAEEKNGFNLDLQVVPVGIYYDNFVNSNSRLFVNYGEPFSIKNYKNLFLGNPQKAYSEFKDELSTRLKKLIIHIQDLDHYKAYEKIRLFYRSTMKKRLGIKGASLKGSFIADQNTIKEAERVFFEGDKNIEVFENQYNRLEKGLRKEGIDILELGSRCIGKRIFNFILLIIGLPIFIFGFLNGYLYYFLSMKFIGRIKDKQFHTSVKYGFGAFIFPILYAIHSLIFYLITGNGVESIFFFIAIVLSVVIANKYRYLFKDEKKQWRILFLRITKPKEYNKIMKARTNLLESLDSLFYSS